MRPRFAHVGCLLGQLLPNSVRHSTPSSLSRVRRCVSLSLFVTHTHKIRASLSPLLIYPPLSLSVLGARCSVCVCLCFCMPLFLFTHCLHTVHASHQLFACSPLSLFSLPPLHLSPSLPLSTLFRSFLTRRWSLSSHFHPFVFRLCPVFLRLLSFIPLCISGKKKEQKKRVTLCAHRPPARASVSFRVESDGTMWVH